MSLTKEIPQHLEVKQELPETLPPLEEFIRLITEQLILHSLIEGSSLLQEIPFKEYCKLQTLDAELPILYPLASSSQDPAHHQQRLMLNIH